MLQRQGRILKRGMKICLAGMPGVTGFGEEAEVGEPQPRHQVFFLLEIGLVSLLPPDGMEADQRQEEAV